MDNELLTAQDFLYEKRHGNGFYDYELPKVLIEFTKLHVKVALEKAYNNAELKEQEKGDEQICCISNDMGDMWVLDKESIINAYPLDLIK